MAIGRYLPSSSLARPGVCTSSTRPASPYEGQAIYETNTDKTYIWNGSLWVEQLSTTVIDAKGDLIVGTAADTASRLAVGSNGRVLEADSAQATGVKWGSVMGLELILTQAIGSNVSSINVPNAFSATYDDYLVTVSGGAGTAADSVFTLRLGNTTTGYYYSLIYSTYGTSVLGAGSTVQSNFVYVGGSHLDGLRANITIQSPFLSKPTGVIAHVQNRVSWSGNMTGYLNNTTSYTDFTLGVSTGTVTGGTIRVYGYRNS